MRGVTGSDLERMPAGDISLGGVFGALNAKKWWIIASTLTALVGSAVFVTVVTPKYTGEAKVFLENRDNYFTRPDREMRGSDPAIDAEAVQSQVQMIMSRDIARSAIEKLGLNTLPEFDSGRRETSTLKKIMSMAGFGKDPLAASPDERVIEAYSDRLLVYNVGKSRVISVEFSSRDPELAARGANTVADEYIRFLRDAKKSTTQGASDWLSQTIESMRTKVAEAESKVEAYRAQNGLLIGSSNTTIATQQLGEMNTQISQARSAQTELQAKARLIREALRNGKIFETSDVVNNELVRRLLEQRVTMKTQIALEERTLLAGHPRMKELSAQLADLETQIRGAAERTARALENDARIAGAKVQSLQSEFEGQKRTAADANSSEVQLRALEREAKALRDNYESYLAKYRDALARNADAAAPADARVISRAAVPQKPTFPKKVPVILLATLATLVLGCAIVVTRTIFAAPAEGDFSWVETVDEPLQPTRVQPAPVVMTAAPEEFVVPASPPPRTVQPDPVPQAPAMAASPPAAPPPASFQSAGRPPEEAAALADAAMAAVRRPRAAAPPAQSAPQPAPQAVDPVADLAADLAGLRQPSSGLVVALASHGEEVFSMATALPLARHFATLGTTVLIDLAGAPDAVEQAAGRVLTTGVTDLLAGVGSFGQSIHKDRGTRLHLIGQGASGFDLDESLAGEGFASILEALAQTYDYIVVDAGPLGTILESCVELAGAIVLVASEDDTNPGVARSFQRLNAVRPGCVTIVVDEASFPPGRPANDRYMHRESAA